MKVELLSYTPDALNLLLRTKNTRLKNDDDPANWTDAQRQEHLDYMRDTIKSSWEFVDYTFRISGVTRVFTHQIVRTRNASYAQEAQRVVNAGENGFLVPTTGTEEARELFRDTGNLLLGVYDRLVEMGMPRQDARGILMNNIFTSINVKWSLRTLYNTALLRMCTRTQGEYQDVFRAMRAEVLKVHPWAEPFIAVHCVSNGTCAFPRYGKTECPIYFAGLDNTPARDEAEKRFWAVRHEAAPVAVAGRT